MSPLYSEVSTHHTVAKEGVIGGEVDQGGVSRAGYAMGSEQGVVMEVERREGVALEATTVIRGEEVVYTLHCRLRRI